MGDDNAAKFIYDQAKKHTVPPHEEQIELLKRHQAGDLAARDEFIRRNQKLVMQRVNKYGTHEFLDPEDLLQEGNLGLIRAMRNFKPALGFRFSTFAAPVIDQFIERAIKSKGSLLKKPASAAAKLARAQRAWSRYVSDFGEKPTQSQLADLCDLTIAELDICKVLLMDHVSLCSPFSEDDDFSYGDAIQCERPYPSETAESSWDKEQVRKWLNKLEKKDRIFIEFRFGIGDNEPKTRVQLSQKYQISEIEVQRWEKRVLERLKSFAPRASINAEFDCSPEVKSVVPKPRRSSKNPIPIRIDCSPVVCIIG